jgi:hypothetical protein
MVTLYGEGYLEQCVGFKDWNICDLTSLRPGCQVKLVGDLFLLLEEKCESVWKGGVVGPVFVWDFKVGTCDNLHL